MSETSPEDTCNERREHWPKDAEFFQKVDRHMLVEELRQKLEEEKFKQGDERMQRIEEDLRPLKSMYYAVLGSAGVGTLLLLTLLYIYTRDRADADVMQQAIYKQGMALEKLMQSHQALERDYRRDISRVEQGLDKYHKYLENKK